MMTEISFQDEPPQDLVITSYDEQHLVTYIRLLDADAEGADWREAISIIFGIDPLAEPARAQKIYDGHIARARWMTEAGYKHLLKR